MTFPSWLRRLSCSTPLLQPPHRSALPCTASCRVPAPADLLLPPSSLPPCPPPCPAGSDGWFYPQHAAENASLREIIHDGFLHPKESK
jgi:hypothetical protein